MFYPHLEQAEIAKIKRLAELGFTYRAIGERFGLTAALVGAIARGKYRVRPLARIWREACERNRPYAV